MPREERTQFKDRSKKVKYLSNTFMARKKIIANNNCTVCSFEHNKAPGTLCKQQAQAEENIILHFIGINLINLKLKRRFFICSVVHPYFRSKLISSNYVQTNYFHGIAYILSGSPVARATCNFILDLSSI